GNTGGGGGGADEIGGTGSGSAGGDGGDGRPYDLNGTSIVVGSGGGGCGLTTNGVGGTGAGSGPGSAGGTGSSGASNRGGGGGCSSGDAANPEDPPIISGSGGSGLVVISYTANSFCRSFRSLGRDPLDVRRQPMDPVELGPGRLACRAGLAG
ncbi:MAG: glycine-rich domain-containing protein, partial [Actinomycetota bacterium]